VELPEKQGLKRSHANITWKCYAKLQWNFQKNKD